MEPTTPVDNRSNFPTDTPRYEAFSSGVSWAAVIGGAAVAAALGLILLALGTGLGLSSVSPWSNSGASASTVSHAAIVWLILMQIISSAMGGYMAGRLRTKWATIHSHEVYFRDTAHGFLVWSVGLVVTAAFLASAAMSILGGTARAPVQGAAMSQRAMGMTSPSNLDTSNYFVDTMLRSDHPSLEGNDISFRAEVGRALSHALLQQDARASDEVYLSQLVVAKTGLSSSDAQKRVSDVIEEERQAEESARKAAARLSLWIFIALLCGAFSASYAATIGGRQRDRVKLA